MQPILQFLFLYWAFFLLSDQTFIEYTYINSDLVFLVAVRVWCVFLYVCLFVHAGMCVSLFCWSTVAVWLTVCLSVSVCSTFGFVTGLCVLQLEFHLSYINGNCKILYRIYSGKWTIWIIESWLVNVAVDSFRLRIFWNCWDYYFIAKERYKIGSWKDFCNLEFHL